MKNKLRTVALKSSKQNGNCFFARHVPFGHPDQLDTAVTGNTPMGHHPKSGNKPGNASVSLTPHENLEMTFTIQPGLELLLKASLLWKLNWAHGVECLKSPTGPPAPN